MKYTMMLTVIRIRIYAIVKQDFCGGCRYCRHCCLGTARSTGANQDRGVLLEHLVCRGQPAGPQGLQGEIQSPQACKANWDPRDYRAKPGLQGSGWTSGLQGETGLRACKAEN